MPSPFIFLIILYLVWLVYRLCLLPMHCGVGSGAPSSGPAHSLYVHVHVFRSRNVRLFLSLIGEGPLGSGRDVRCLCSYVPKKEHRRALSRSVRLERTFFLPPCVAPPSFLPSPHPPSFPHPTWPRRRIGGIGRSALYRAECILPRRERFFTECIRSTKQCIFVVVFFTYLQYILVSLQILFCRVSYFIYYYRGIFSCFYPLGGKYPFWPFVLVSWPFRVFKKSLLYIYFY